MTRAEDILEFWFGADEASSEERQRRWFTTDPDFDRICAELFLPDYEAAAAGKLEEWKSEPRATLALVILLDQLPRNMFRNTAQAFATDAKALETARGAIGSRFDHKLAAFQRTFFYIPFQHSETLADQDESVRLTREVARDHPECAGFVKYAELHRDVIRRFGRFPHRNAILARASTPEETAFLRNHSMF
jgi:uncharacterized protein (DUF924 family)